MKMRENELHEPKIETDLICVPMTGYDTTLKCAICENKLYFEFISIGAFQNVNHIKAYILGTKTPNYCPNCGARLKEIEE